MVAVSNGQPPLSHAEALTMGLSALEAFDLLVRYDPVTGELFWRMRPEIDTSAKRFNSRYAGRRIDTKSSRGYIFVNALGCSYPAHHVVWFLTYGRWPEGIVDHINGCRTDNRIENLRLATHSQNCWNSKNRSSNKSGVKGVFFNNQRGKWQAAIQVGCQQIWLGYHSTLESAAFARVSTRVMLPMENNP